MRPWNLKTLKIETIQLPIFLSPLNREDENKFKKKKKNRAEKYEKI